MEYYDTLVVLAQPERIPGVEKPVCGFGIPHCDMKQDVMTTGIQYYIEYLCGIQRWIAEGGKIDDENSSILYEKEGTKHNHSLEEEFFDIYEADAYADKPIDYMVIFNANTSFRNDEVDNDFITKNIRGLWKR